MTPFELRDSGTVGRQLHRPECVLCTSDGSIYTSDWGGGVTVIRPDGAQTRLLGKQAPVELRPNGIALQRDGSFLLANLGDAGGVWRLSPDGRIEPFAIEAEGESIPPSNFVLADHNERTWITVSTTLSPRQRAFRNDIADGLILLVENGEARVAADGLGYTNEVQVHPSGRWLYANETFGRRLSRFRIRENGALGPRETVAEFGNGVYPDGLAFDEEMAIWVVSIVSNRIIRIAADGEQRVILEDADPDFLEEVEVAFQSGQMGGEHLARVKSKRLQNVSSVAFGGTGRRISYLGCLLGDRLATYESPVSGVKPIHWDWGLPRSR